LALPRMAVGELVRLHCAAPYAYGERGAPPLIPPNTAVIFELELVSLRYLQSSHNEEEVDFLAKYNSIVQNRARASEARTAAPAPPDPAPDSSPVPGPQDPPPPAGRSQAASQETEVPSPLPGSGDASRPAAPPAWKPSYLELQGQHSSGYNWRETDEEMEVSLPLPVGVAKADIACEIMQSQIRLRIQKDPALLDGSLVGSVDVDGSAWSFEHGGSLSEPDCLVISLAKRDRGLWGYVLAADRARADAGQRPPDVTGPSDASEEPVAGTMMSPGVDWIG